MGLCLPRGPIHNRYGSWTRLPVRVRRTDVRARPAAGDWRSLRKLSGPKVNGRGDFEAAVAAPVLYLVPGDAEKPRCSGEQSTNLWRSMIRSRFVPALFQTLT
ncbi:hypothetical protein DFR52_105179 [Hoeflea marina]|uniref:Uncharacterized protein n=1 Tax=Hoeflea marina TaxID=274592 RepID=A0A317PER8_9HYPH|nr:hypothetical protein [Hoeflea marina]PWV98198.1 hypothetical protein DFR52_105179 [Hoeflea marina]